MQNMSEQKIGSHLIGKKLDELAKGTRVAIDRMDGEPMVTTCDWDPTRFRVHVEAGVITAVTGMG